MAHEARFPLSRLFLTRVVYGDWHLSEVRGRDAAGFAMATTQGPEVVKGCRPA